MTAENDRIVKDLQCSCKRQLSTKFQHILNRLKVIFTKRRSLFDFGMIGLSIVVKDGPVAFLHRVRKRYSQKFINASNVPIIEISVVSPSTLLSLSKSPLFCQFTATTNNLNKIKIFTATCKQQNSDIEFQITDTNGHILRRRIIKGYNVLDNNYTSFEFKPIRNSKGQTFFLKMISKGETSVSVWYNEGITLLELNLYYNNEPIKGSIGFQVFADQGIKNPYDLWILKNEPTKAKLKQYEKEIKDFSYQPKISIVTPVYNPDVSWIKAAIESVTNQVYQNWELCIADASSKEDVKRCLKTYSEKDPRIKVQYLFENKGISGNSNEALSLATGEYIGLLDHDDELSLDALYEVVKYLQSNPDADIIYSDEDRIDLKGNRRDPFFKPDWSPDMFLSHNYLCHLSVIRKDFVENVGGFREGYDGSQDYDLFLRVEDSCGKIGHIPKVLYHWRIVPGSTADGVSKKIYTLKATENALIDTVKRRKLNAKVISGLFPNSFRVKYNIIENPKISIIITTKDRVKSLQACIASILEKTDYLNYEIIIVDNQSKEEATCEYYKKMKINPKIKILQYTQEFNFSEMNNFAISQIDSDYAVFLNNDTEVISREWLSAMLEHAQRKEVGAVGAKLIYSNNTVQHAGIIIGIIENLPVYKYSHKHFSKNENGYFGRIGHVNNVSAVTAACMMVRKELFEEVSGFDETNLAAAYNDIDLCLKIREKGYLIVYTPYAELYHHKPLRRSYNNTLMQERFSKEVGYIGQKWGKVIENGDPYYSPNLTLEKEDFSIKV